jgi:hypothetical protein
VNGESSKVGFGDELVSLVRARCAAAACSQVVAVVWLNMPPPGSDRTALFYAEAQAIDRLQPLPVGTRMVQVDLTVASFVLADCTAHGRITMRAAALLQAARQVKGDRTATLDVTPDGKPIGHDLVSNAMTVAEQEAWIGARRADE